MSEEPEDLSKDPEVIKITEALQKATEDWDCIQIFCSRMDPDGTGETQRFKIGRGNFYARLGYVRDWLIEQDENTRMEVRKMDDK